MIVELEPPLLESKRVVGLLKRFKAVVGFLIEPVLKEVPAPIDLAIRDTHRVIHEIVDHCVASGRRRLCLAGTLESNPDKVLPFLSRLRHHGLPDEYVLLDLPPLTRSSCHYDFYYEALDRAYSGPPPFDAFIAASDDGAGAASVWLREKGVRVPEDIAIFALGDSDLLKVAVPPIAGADRHHEVVADTVVRLFFERLEDPSLPSRCEALPMDVVWRESAGPRIGA